MVSKKKYGLETSAIRDGSARSHFNEHSEALYLTSSFVFKNAREAALRFSGDEAGMVYSRYTNPNLSMFEERLASLEGGEVCVSTASGMSAILGVVMSLLEPGDEILASKNLFGATKQLFSGLLNKFGIKTTYINASDLNEWEKEITRRTKIFFLETPSNPLTEVADIAEISKLAKSHNVLLVVDNCFCTPALQKPILLGADIVIHSATKYLDGQGRVMGGAVVGRREVIEKPLVSFLRSAGATLSPFNAWVLFKGLETLKVRMDAHSESALKIAQWLMQHPKVKAVHYPWLDNHPQNKLAKAQQSAGGGIVSFEVKGGKEDAWKVIDNVQIVSITANLGDTRTTITHPGTTTHGRLSEEDRLESGITDGLIRLAVGLETVEDLQDDLDFALTR
ncbi:MAG: O-succinylhomoserine sulfhydrylase [Betaproteobacteria bacterium]